jgi:hypothetical protein
MTWGSTVILLSDSNFMTSDYYSGSLDNFQHGFVALFSRKMPPSHCQGHGFPNALHGEDDFAAGVGGHDLLVGMGGVGQRQ